MTNSPSNLMSALSVEGLVPISGQPRVEAALIIELDETTGAPTPASPLFCFGPEDVIIELKAGELGPDDQQVALEGPNGRHRLLVRLAQQDQAPGSGPVTRPPEKAIDRSVDVRFFGRPRLVVDGVSYEVQRGRSLSILAALASASPASMDPDKLIRTAWPANDTSVSHNAVYTAVSRLRHYLEGLGLDHLVERDAFGYRLAVEPESIDITRFEQQGQALLDAGDDAGIEDLRLLLSRDAHLAFRAGDSLVLDRWGQQISELRSRLAHLLTRNLARNDQLDEAIARCYELLADQPWREATWSMLIACLYRAGRAKDALATYAEARDRLRDELGLEPGPSLAQMELRILSHDQSLLRPDWLDDLHLP
jgi:pentatricopeptide repeat protein